VEEEVSDSVRLYGREPWSDTTHDSSSADEHILLPIGASVKIQGTKKHNNETGIVKKIFNPETKSYVVSLKNGEKVRVKRENLIQHDLSELITSDEQNIPQATDENVEEESINSNFNYEIVFENDENEETEEIDTEEESPITENLESSITDMTSTLIIKAHSSLSIANFFLFSGFILLAFSLILLMNEEEDAFICIPIASSMISFSLVMFVRSISYSNLSPDKIKLVKQE
jgi:hypothetical protein